MRGGNFAVIIRRDIVVGHGYILYDGVFQLLFGLGALLAGKQSIFIGVAEFKHLRFNGLVQIIAGQCRIGEIIRLYRRKIVAVGFIHLSLHGGELFIREGVKAQLFFLLLDYSLLYKGFDSRILRTGDGVFVGCVERHAIHAVHIGLIVQRTFNGLLHFRLGISFPCHVDNYRLRVDGRVLFDEAAACAEHQRGNHQKCQKDTLAHVFGLPYRS